MNKILFFLLVLIAPSAIAQITIDGVLKDVNTQEPVEAATISADGSNSMTISNVEGHFRIILPEGSKSITISHLSYKTYTTQVNPQGKDLEVFLEPSGIELEEVVVANKPVNEILGDIVDNSKKHLEKALLLNTYFREFVKVNNSYTKFADGLLDYYVKRKSGASDLYVKQSRSFRLKEVGTEGDNKQLIDALYLFDVRDAITYSYGFKSITRLLSDKNYDYQLKMRKDKEGRSVEIITVIPKPGITEMMLTATVVYDPVKKLILDMDIKYSEEHKKYSKERNLIIFKFTLLDAARKTSFKIDGDKYILTYNKTHANFHVKMKNRLDDTFEFLSDNVVMDYKEGEFELDKSKRYKEKSLFAAGTNFTTEYWKTSNALLLTDAEEKIIKSFEKN
jgi:hypothetical protein